MELGIDTYRDAVFRGRIDATGMMKTLDWDRLVELVLEHRPESVRVALEGDYLYPEVVVWSGGVPRINPTGQLPFWYTSAWAIPCARLEFKDRLVSYTCWKYFDPQHHDPHETWPESALCKLGLM